MAFQELHDFHLIYVTDKSNYFLSPFPATSSRLDCLSWVLLPARLFFYINAFFISIFVFKIL